MANLFLVRRTGVLLTNSSWFKRLTYKVFSNLYHRRSRRYLVELGIVWLLGTLTALVAGFHKEPAAEIWKFLISWVVPFFVVLMGIVLVELPLGVVAFYEEKARLRDMLINRELSRVLYFVENDGSIPTFNAGEVVSNLSEVVKNGQGPVYLVTPNALYVLADQWKNLFTGNIEDPEMLELLGMLSTRAESFRSDLINSTRPIHWVMPDLGFDLTRTFLETRAEELGISRELVRRVNKEAVHWVEGKLKRDRRKKSQWTYLHRVRCLPGYRLLVTGEVCFFQSFPRTGHGLKQPVFMVTRKEYPQILDAIQLALKFWSE